MEARSVNFIAAACAGEILAGSPALEVSRVCTDSRQAEPGDLFVAIAGERFDGHQFLAEATARGVTAALVERAKAAVSSGPMAVIAVDDTRKALGRLAATYRSEFSLLVAAVCGSNGKTTTKELIAAVLSQKFNTVWSDGSFNNDIGVPLSILKLTPAHSAAVFEAGTNHPGELPPLLEMIAPRYGVLTNIGREHLEFFGDLEGVAREEGTLAEILPANGTLFVNGDDPWSGAIAARSRAAVLRVGLQDRNDWRASHLRADLKGLTFSAEGPSASHCGEYRVNVVGAHQVHNALFAIALGHQLGLTREQVKSGLAASCGARMRMQVWQAGEVTVLDDAYNANADSMRAALQALRDLPCKGRRLAVLGDMAELGQHTETAHEEIGRFAAECGIDQLFTVGKLAGQIARSARQAGLNRVLEFLEVESASAAVKSFVKPGDLLLLKASRAMHLERLAGLLRGKQ